MEKILIFFADSSGATMVEYGIMVAIIAMACFTGVQAFGTAVLGLYQNAVGRMP
jgi:Flp pilus assembly pilin Flp